MQMNDFLGPLNLKRGDVQNWLGRPTIELRTKYQETVSGSPRRFSKANVTELGLIGALVSVGCKPSDAVSWAETLIEEKRRPAVKRPRYLVCPAQNFDKGSIVISLDELDLEQLMVNTSTAALIIIDVGAVFDRVDRLFLDHQTEG